MVCTVRKNVYQYYCEFMIIIVNVCDGYYNILSRDRIFYIHMDIYMYFPPPSIINLFMEEERRVTKLLKMLNIR